MSNENSLTIDGIEGVILFKDLSISPKEEEFLSFDISRPIDAFTKNLSLLYASSATINKVKISVKSETGTPVVYEISGVSLENYQVFSAGSDSIEGFSLVASKKNVK